jgi:DNA-binding transcriptional regulator YiaG
MTRKCAECGKPMAHRGYMHEEKVGKNSVTDATAFAWQCPGCGEVDMTLDELAGYQRRAAAIVLREAKDIEGAVKYARKAIGMKQSELAERLGVATETLSRYETGAAEVPPGVRLAIVAVLEGVENAGGLEAYLEQSHARNTHTFEVAPRRCACA